MTRSDKPATSPARSLRTLAMVNTGMWLIAMIAMVFVIQKAPAAKGMMVILMSGMGMSITLLSQVGKAR